MFISSSAPMAIQGASEYGTTVYPSTFEPECNAYEYTSSGATYMNVKGSTDGQDGFIDTLFSSNEELLLNKVKFPMQFFVNATNQPSFGDGKVCDEYIRYFDTSISKGDYAAVPVRGTVKANAFPFEKEMSWTDALGVRVDSAFIENHMVSCEGLRGYKGTGEQNVEMAWKSSRTVKGKLVIACTSCTSCTTFTALDPTKANHKADGWSSNSTFSSLYSLQVALSNLMTPIMKGSPK
jgi:hypothetical protein